MGPNRWLAASVIVMGATLAGCSGGGGVRLENPPPKAPEPSAGAVPWPAPQDPLERARLAGLRPETRESLEFHVHAHLDVFVNGTPVLVPAGIGINIDDPGVKRLETENGIGYGGIEMCIEPCVSPLHAHDQTGILHTESATDQPNTLGQFFVEWGVRLDASCVGGYCRPEASIFVFVDGGEPGGHRAHRPQGDCDRDRLTAGRDPGELRLLSGPSLVASRQDVREEATGCLSKDVLETSFQE